MILDGRTIRKGLLHQCILSVSNMEEGKDRVLIIGATGHVGRRLVAASLALGHPTFLLFRPENVSNPHKCQMFMEFKMQGAHLLQGSIDDYESLISALKRVDVVISAVRDTTILAQLKLLDAIKEVGTIKRFLPSEFGMDVDRMTHAIPPGDAVFADKRAVRRAVEAAGVPHTYVSANCFNAFFLAGLAQLATFMPPRDRIRIHGAGDKSCIWVAEEDVAAYTMLAASDPRALNKVLYVRPPANILTQMEVVGVWEKLIGRDLEKTFVSEAEWLSSMNEWPPREQVAIAHLYQIYYRGDLDFQVQGPLGVDSSILYPEHKYVTVEEYLRRFL